MYYELETIVEYLSWTVADIKSLTVRERKHWFKKAMIKKTGTK